MPRFTVIYAHADGTVGRTTHPTWSSARRRFESVKKATEGQIVGDWQMQIGRGQHPTLVYITTK